MTRIQRDSNRWLSHRFSKVEIKGFSGGLMHSSGVVVLENITVQQLQWRCLGYNLPPTVIIVRMIQNQKGTLTLIEHAKSVFRSVYYGCLVLVSFKTSNLEELFLINVGSLKLLIIFWRIKWNFSRPSYQPVRDSNRAILVVCLHTHPWLQLSSQTRWTPLPHTSK